MSILFFLFWIVLNGRLTLELVVLGIAIATLVSVFAWSVLGYSPVFELIILRRLPLLVRYVLTLLAEIVKAAFSVMGVAFGLHRPDPVIVEFHSGLDSTLNNVILANSITLTPGTYTIFQEGDRFVVHCLRREYAEGLSDCAFVKLLRRVKWE